MSNYFRTGTGGGTVPLLPVKYFGELDKNDSKEEAYFDWWVKPLLKEGLIKAIHQPGTMICAEPLELIRQVEMKTKTKWVSKNVLQEYTYTADRVIQWDESANGVLFTPFYYNEFGQLMIDKYANIDAFFLAFKGGDGDYYSVIDIKPSYVGPNNSSGITFPLKQHLMWIRHRIYVQKVKLFPSGKKKATKNHLFPATFTPDRYFITDANRGMRKIHYPITSFKEWWV